MIEGNDYYYSLFLVRNNIITFIVPYIKVSNRFQLFIRPKILSILHPPAPVVAAITLRDLVPKNDNEVPKNTIILNYLTVNVLSEAVGLLTGIARLYPVTVKATTKFKPRNIIHISL